LPAGHKILGSVAQQGLVRFDVQSDNARGLYEIAFKQGESVFRGQPVWRRQTSQNSVGLNKSRSSDNHLLTSIKAELNLISGLRVVFMPSADSSNHTIRIRKKPLRHF
jgi:hypothetical protein